MCTLNKRDVFLFLINQFGIHYILPIVKLKRSNEYRKTFKDLDVICIEENVHFHLLFIVARTISQGYRGERSPDISD